MPQRLKPINNNIRSATEVIRILLPGASAPQPRLRVVVLPRGKMGLCAPFDDDEGERNSQNRAAESGADRPVVDDAFGAVVGIVLEVDVAAAGTPNGTHAVAVLVGADDLRHGDVSEQAGVADFEEAEEEDFPSVSAGEGFPELEKSSDGRLDEFVPAAGLLMREAALETAEDSGDDVLFGDDAFGYKPPD